MKTDAERMALIRQRTAQLQRQARARQMLLIDAGCMAACLVLVFLQRQKKPPPGLAAQCEIAPGFIEVSLEAAILNGPLSCKNMGKGFDHQILCLVDIAQHAVDVKGQRVAIPLHQQLSSSFVSGQILPVGCFV